MSNPTRLLISQLQPRLILYTFCMFLLFFILCFLLTPIACRAQTPLLFQIIAAYKPSSLILSTPQTNIPTPLPTPNSQPQVLGISTTLPAIGGQGKIITIVVLGDSMIDTLGKDIPSLQIALQKYYPNTKFNIINYGVGASNLQYALFRLTHDYRYLDGEYPSIISLNPDILIVESFAYNNYGNSQAGIDKQWLQLGELTTTVKEKLPHAKIVLAATIAPNSITFGNGIKDHYFNSMEKQEKANTIKLYLQNLVNFATSQNFPLANAYHPSLVNNDGNKNFISAIDNLHPSVYGGQLFCNLLAKTIFDHKLVE